MAEVAFAIEEGKEVIPVLFRDCKIPFRLRPFQHVDFRGDYSEALDVLLNSVGVERPPAVSAIVVPSQEEPERPPEFQVAADRLALLHRQAEAGDAQAMAELGCIYGKGKEVERAASRHSLGLARQPRRVTWMACSIWRCSMLMLMQKRTSGKPSLDRKAAEAEPSSGCKTAYMYELARGSSAITRKQ